MTTMTTTRTLGRIGIEVSALGVGCWAIGGPFWEDGKPLGWGEVDDDESLRALHRALDLGVAFFDTANSGNHTVVDGCPTRGTKRCQLADRRWANRAGDGPKATSGCHQKTIKAAKRPTSDRNAALSPLGRQLGAGALAI